MRFVVYGVGAIGGTVAAALAAAGQDVVGIARGAQLQAIRADGLLLRAVAGEVRARFGCVAHPREIAFRPDDMILLTMKTQDTWPALQALRAAGVTGQPVFCVQNGVENERMALRLFPNVHGVTVMMPATYSVPGEVAVFAGPRYGMFDLGRYPDGLDADDAVLATALEAANIAAFPAADVMASKYGKLRMNLVNILGAALGQGADQGEWPERLRAEAVAVYSAAGIAWTDVGPDDPRRRDLLTSGDVAGARRTGNSTLQSLLRGAASLETDYLNGEIVLLGRKHDVPTPANTAMTRLAARMLRDGAVPGALRLADLAAATRD